jgi:hypothetical protein
MFASGGPYAFVKTSLAYIDDQGSVSSGLFGASDLRWQSRLAPVGVDLLRAAGCGDARGAGVAAP